MAWTTPATFTTGQIVTAADLNTQIRDNLIYLLNRPAGMVKLDLNANLTTTSSTFTEVNTGFRVTLNISGSAVLLGFTGVLSAATGYAPAYFDFLIDGVRYTTGSEGIAYSTQVGSTGLSPVSFTAFVIGLSAGSHVFSVAWRVQSGLTAQLFCGDNNPGTDFIPCFYAAGQ